MCAEILRGEENSDCTEQSEGNGVVLKITKICFNSLKQIL